MATSEEPAGVFYPPVPVPTPKLSVLADVYRFARRFVLAVATLSATVAAVPFVARYFRASFAGFCRATACRTTSLWRRFYPRSAIALIGSIYRSVRKPIFIAGRITALIFPSLTMYAAVTTAPAPSKLSTENQIRTTAVTLAGASSAPVAPKPIGDVTQFPAGSSASAHAPADVKIVSAPRLNPFCREQTWPYITQRCLAARNGQINLTKDPAASIPTGSRNAAADPPKVDAADTGVDRESDEPVRTR
jgi:hypothetical protein